MNNETEQYKLSLACQTLSSYFARHPDVKVQGTEYEAVKAICEYIIQTLKK